MSSESKIIQNKKCLSIFSEKVYKLWPWLRETGSNISAKDLDKYYELTYSFGEETWINRLQDGADEDESQRAIFAVLTCLEFGFDGSSSSKPGLWEFWRKLHKQVICPCFKKGKGEEVISRYISWPVKTFGIDEGLLRTIWHKVYDSTDSTLEEEWISEHFHAWIMMDRTHFISRTEEEYSSNKKLKTSSHSSDLNIGVENKDEEKSIVKTAKEVAESENKNKRKVKLPAPKKRSIPKPKSRPNIDNENENSD